MLTIRPATPADLPLLPAIERDAAQTFLEVGYDFCVADVGCTPEMFAAACEAGGLLVAECGAELAGFALLWFVEDWAHLHELDVLRARQGQGIGRALVQGAAGLARERGCRWMSLTTFAEVPWNAPFYARVGFNEFDAGDAPGKLAQSMAEELAHGDEAHPRVAMRMSL